MQITNVSPYAADYFRFRKNGALFVPKIAESIADFDPEFGYDGAVITLDAGLTSDLNWEAALSDAEKLPLIVWKFDFGLSRSLLPLTSELAFNSFRLALEHFTKNLWPRFQTKTFGLILFEGPADLTSLFPWNEDYKESFAEFKGEWNLSQERALRTFCLKSLMDYLHQLVSILPDEILLFAQFDGRSLSCPIESAQTFSKELFSHIYPAIWGAHLPQFGLRWRSGAMRGGFIGRGAIPDDCAPVDSTLGFVLPEVPDEGEGLKEAIAELEGPYRLIDESVLAESWDELEEIAIVEELLTVFGKRKLKAFEAAGGKVRGRGI